MRMSDGAYRETTDKFCGQRKTVTGLLMDHGMQEVFMVQRSLSDVISVISELAPMAAAE
jgi:hypothetical protein